MFRPPVRAAALTASAMGLVLLMVTRAHGAPGTSYAERVRETVLANGMKLILLEDHKAPVAVVQVWYRVGSRNEALGHTGLSHLLEHMMFKGTDRVAPEEYSKIIQRNGGQTNAFTAEDYTTYFATIASDRVGVVVDLEADRLAHLKVTPALYDPERAVVMEERRLRTDNNPVAALFEQLQATAYAAHPYEFPIIGWMSDIERSTAADLERHYRTYYVPNNAFVVAVGDFDATQLAAELERLFGPIPSGEKPPAVRSVEPPQMGERRLELRREAELPYLAMTHHVPNLQSADAPALEVLSAVLSDGESTRLHNALVYRQRLATSVGADYEYLSVDPGLFTLYAQPLPGKSAAAVEKALLAEIAKVSSTPPSDAEMAKAKKGIEAAAVFAQDSIFYQSLLLGQYEINGDWRRIDQYLPAIRAVTAADVSRVAAQYLNADNRTTATLVPIPPKDGRPAPPMAPPGPIH